MEQVCIDMILSPEAKQSIQERLPRRIPGRYDKLGRDPWDSQTEFIFRNYMLHVLDIVLTRYEKSRADAIPHFSTLGSNIRRDMAMILRSTVSQHGMDGSVVVIQPAGIQDLPPVWKPLSFYRIEKALTGKSQRNIQKIITRWHEDNPGKEHLTLVEYIHETQELHTRKETVNAPSH